MEDIMNLISINQIKERNEMFNRLNIPKKSTERSEIMNLRKQFKKRENRREKQAQEEKEYEEKIVLYESLKNSTSAMVENNKKRLDFAKNVLQDTEELTRQWQMEESSAGQRMNESNIVRNFDESNVVQDIEQPSTSCEPVDESLDEYSDAIDQAVLNLAEYFENRFEKEIIKKILLEKDTRKRNVLFNQHRFTKEDKVKVMDTRRTFKNRKYAKTKRDNLDKEIEDLYEKNNYLLEDTKRNNGIIIQRELEIKELKARALELSKEHCHWEQMLERQKRNEEINKEWNINPAEEILPDVWLIPQNEK